ncbi:MAG: hypothetical protein ABIQ16_07765, partial [Polyangiaceae bacterium]
PVADAPSQEAGEVPRPRFDDHPLAIELRTGAATATGLLGVVLEYNVHDRLAFNAGVGTNLLGLSSSVGARVRPVIGASGNRKQLHAFVVETSLSRSAYLGDWIAGFPCDDHCIQPRYVGWAQAELGWEARIGHWQLQTTLGAAFLLGNPQFSCRQDGFDSPANCASSGGVTRVLFTQTIGAGYAF